MIDEKSRTGALQRCGYRLDLRASPVSQLEAVEQRLWQSYGLLIMKILVASVITARSCILRTLNVFVRACEPCDKALRMGLCVLSLFRSLVPVYREFAGTDPRR